MGWFSGILLLSNFLDGGHSVPEAFELSSCLVLLLALKPIAKFV